jgi:hypothetical protein
LKKGKDNALLLLKFGRTKAEELDYKGNLHAAAGGVVDESTQYGCEISLILATRLFADGGLPILPNLRYYRAEPVLAHFLE